MGSQIRLPEERRTRIYPFIRFTPFNPRPSLSKIQYDRITEHRIHHMLVHKLLIWRTVISKSAL